MITPFYLPIKLVFGPGSLKQLGEEARAIGRKAMIVTYPDIRRIGLLDRVVKDLKSKGVDALVFDELEPNPRCSVIDKGAGVARAEKIELVIGLGGGSAMDAAKGIALASSGNAPIWDYVLDKAQVTGRVPSLIQVPTLAGTGSELNQIAVFTDWVSKEKRVLFNPNLWAKTSIIDPELTLSVPQKQTASGGVDILAHIMECYLMPESPLPLNDAIREATMKIVVKYLPQALVKPDNIEARTQLSWASSIAGSSISRVGGSVGSMTCHGIEHAVSGYYDINHGAGLAALLPAWMRQLQPLRKARFDMLGANVFGKKDGIQGFEAWLEEVGLKLRLRDLGCELKSADEIAVLALKVWDFQQHPGGLDAAGIARIYREAF
jgi:alcohol dehydrogenase class IV